MIWQDFCGLTFKQYFKVLTENKKVSLEKEKNKFKNLILNLNHRGIYHESLHISSLKYVYLQDALTFDDILQPTIVLTN